MEHITLYTQSLNPYAEKVARALHYKRLPFERVVSDDPNDYRRWSPATGKLPVLEVDGKRVADSSAILRWIEELWPKPPLLSTDPVLAQQQRSMAEWSDASFVYYWNRWRAARFPQPGDEQPANPSMLGKLRTNIVRALGRRDGTTTRAQLREMQILDELSKRMDDLVAMLGERPFFHGDHLSVADLSVFGMLQVLGRSPMNEGGTLLPERAVLGAYMARVEESTRAPSEPCA